MKKLPQTFEITVNVTNFLSIFLYLGLYTLLVVSCSTTNNVYQDSILEKYATEFSHMTGLDTSHIDIRFADLKQENGSLERTAGICYYKSRRILVDKVTWQTLTDNRRRWLMYHELGHCVNYADHIDGLDENQCPKSIMASMVPEEHIIRDCLKLKSFKEYVNDIKGDTIDR